MIVKTRREAAEAGEVRYYTGRPCAKNHVAERYTASGNCVQCASERSGVYATMLKAARFNGDLVEFKAEIHKDDREAVQSLIDALAAARALV